MRMRVVSVGEGRRDEMGKERMEYLLKMEIKV